MFVVILALGLFRANQTQPTSGPAPGVLVWPDIFGLRPAFRQMGRRLAESGYSVLVVNPFYRQKKAPTAPAKRTCSVCKEAVISLLF